MKSLVTSRATRTAALVAGVALLVIAFTACASQSPLLGLEVSVTLVGSGGVVSEPEGISCPDDCKEQVEPGTTIQLSAEPAAGQQFLGWSGDCEGTSPTCEVVVDGPTQVTASFAKAPIRVDDVSGTTGGAGCTLRDAIIAANIDEPFAGCETGQGADVIELPAGAIITLTQAHEDLGGATGLPSVTSEITVVGSGASIQRDASEEFRLFHVGESGNLRLEALTLLGGNAGGFDGGAVYVAGGSFSARDVTFEGNRVGNGRAGGAVHNQGGSVELLSVTMLENFAPGEGSSGVGTGSAVANVDGQLSISDSQFRFNGGFIGGERGVIASLGFDAYTVVTDTVIADNGALGLFNAGEIHMDRVEVSLSATEQLGGIVNEGVAFLTDVTIDDNDGAIASGILNTGFMRLRSSSVTNHQTSLGFTGVRNDGIMEVIESVIADNDSFGATGVGGGITNSGRLTLVDSRVVRNTADEGGGVRNTGELILIGSVVDDNQAAFGGGIHSAGSVDLLASTVVGGEVGNTASGQGGGIYVAASPETNRIDLQGASAIRGNASSGDGGGIYAEVTFGLGLCATCAIEQNVSETGVGGGIFAPGVGFGSIYAPAIHDNSPDAVAPGALLVLSVAASEDDAEEVRNPSETLPAGAVKLDEPVMDLSRDTELGVGQFAGLRFTDVQLPPGADLVDARLVFTATADDDGQAALIVGVEDSVSAAPFTSAQFDLSGRPRLGSTYWELPAWAEGETGPSQASPSLRNQAQQLVDAPGWTAGAAVAFIIESATGDGSAASRRAHTFDGEAEKAAQLWLLYFDSP